MEFEKVMVAGVKTHSRAKLILFGFCVSQLHISSVLAHCILSDEQITAVPMARQSKTHLMGFRLQFILRASPKVQILSFGRECNRIGWFYLA